MRGPGMALLIALLCAGCGWSPVPTAQPGAQTTSSATTTVRPPCTAQQLHASLGPDISPPSGLHPGSIRLFNSGPACSLSGYPQMVMAHIGSASSVRRLPFRVSHRGDQVITAARPRPFAVAYGESAWVGVDKYRCDRGDGPAPTLVEVEFPSGIVLFIPDGQPDWSYCGAGDPGSILYVSPFEPTLAAALTH